MNAPQAKGPPPLPPLTALTADLRELLARNGLQVPAYPAVLAKLARLLGQADYTLVDLTRIIEADPTLAASVLRCASTAAHAGHHLVPSLSRAIVQLGTQSLLRSAVGGLLGKVSQAAGPLAPARRLVWKEAIIAAALAELLAPGRHIDPEVAFLCGLLHDFGKVVVLAALDDLIRHRPLPPALPIEEWLVLIERHHVEAGARGAAEWQLPAEVIAIIRTHHDPAGNACVSLVRQADEIVKLAGKRTSITALDLAAIPGLSSAECRRVAEALPGIGELVESFSPASGPAGAGKSLIAPAAGADKPLAEVDFVVVHDRSERPTSFRAVGIGWDALVIVGDEPLNESSLVKVRLEVDPQALTTWMSVISAAADGQAYRMRLTPFALATEAKVAFGRIVNAALGRTQEVRVRSVNSADSLPVASV